MKKIGVIFIYILFVRNCFCQINLVSNGGFENLSSCPTISKPFAAINWYIPSSMKLSVSYHTCSSVSCYSVPSNCWGGLPSYQLAHSGNGYTGGTFFYNSVENWRVYVQSKLMDSLKKDKLYYAEFFVSLANPSKIACNNIQLLFTKTAIYQDTLNDPLSAILANAQIVSYGNPIITDTVGWVKVSGILKSKGGESYITVGNFKTNLQTDTIRNKNIISSNEEAGYYIDDVSVIPLDSFNLKADAGKDTTIHIGDSVFIGTYTNGIDTIKWQILITNTTIDSLRPGFWVKPTTDICYTLTQTVNGFTSSDTVCVYVLPLPLTFLKFEVRNTIGGGSIPLLGGLRGGLIENIWQTASEINVSHFNIQRSINGKDFTTIGKVAAQNKITNEYTFYDSPPLEGLGVVYYRIESVDKDGRKQYSETKTINYQPQTINGFSIFPNPAKDNVTIECKGAKELMIIDYLGRVMYKEILRQAQNNSNGINHLSLTINHYPKGVYVVKAMMNNGEIKTEKLVVQ